jgi:hypothetical protein
MTQPPSPREFRVEEEFQHAQLPNDRLVQRAGRLVTAVRDHPNLSLPQMLGSEAALEAAYRFFSNPRVDSDTLFAATRQRTVERAQAEGLVIVVHDTTDLVLPHADPVEMGFHQTGKPGFYLHSSLVLTATLPHQPLGVVARQTRHRPQRSKRGNGPRRASGATTTQDPEREFLRWREGIDETERVLHGHAQVINVMDRETDCFELEAHLVDRRRRFVLRSRIDRVARSVAESESEPWSKLYSLTEAAPFVLEREVWLSKRKAHSAPRANAVHPPRETRLARLHVAAMTVELKGPQYGADHLPTALRLNVVRVYEPEVPAGEKPVEWLLFTTEPIATAEDVAFVVDVYRARWVIEEYHQALKTGCHCEERRLESREALLNLLVMLLPVACYLVWLRGQGRREPDAPATTLLSPVQLAALRLRSPRPLGEVPTNREVSWAIAGLGGHLKRNGEPGWKTLMAGYLRLLEYTVGFVDALRLMAAGAVPAELTEFVLAAPPRPQMPRRGRRGRR